MLILYCNSIVYILFLLNIHYNYSYDRKDRDNIVEKCEFDALTLGSAFADVFNAPIGLESWEDRVYQDFITEQLGFAQWIANGKSGKTRQEHNSMELQQQLGWQGKKIEDSPYAVLNHKWIYMFGDSTTRQVWASFGASFQGNNFERNAKEWTRQYCNAQEHRTRHAKGGYFPEEGWEGPCGVNEVVCHISGFGDKGLLSFDWKHFPYEDYDEWMWGIDGPWKKGFPGEGSRRPDVLTIQFGLHTCWHSHPEGLYSKRLTEVNETMLSQHISDIKKLMASIREAIDHPWHNSSEIRNPTTVIIVTSGSTGSLNGANMNECILRINRAAANAAHMYGFSVLERGEIEHRIMYKSFQNPEPLLDVEMHLAQPVQNIIATCLLRLINCLHNSSHVLNDEKLNKELFGNGNYVNVTHAFKRGIIKAMTVPPPGR